VVRLRRNNSERNRRVDQSLSDESKERTPHLEIPIRLLRVTRRGKWQKSVRSRSSTRGSSVNARAGNLLAMRIRGGEGLAFTKTCIVRFLHDPLWHTGIPSGFVYIVGINGCSCKVVICQVISPCSLTGESGDVVGFALQPNNGSMSESYLRHVCYGIQLTLVPALENDDRDLGLTCSSRSESLSLSNEASARLTRLFSCVQACVTTP
jgi:hypothetical protein